MMDHEMILSRLVLSQNSKKDAGSVCLALQVILRELRKSRESAERAARCSVLLRALDKLGQDGRTNIRIS